MHLLLHLIPIPAWLALACCCCCCCNLIQALHAAVLLLQLT
jgi:hypothetical protein